MTNFLMEYWLQLILSLLTTGFVALGGMVVALFSGVRALLRDRIIQAYNHYHDKGFCPIYARENISTMLKAYTLLRGNGPIPGLVEALFELPTESPEERED